MSVTALVRVERLLSSDSAHSVCAVNRINICLYILSRLALRAGTFSRLFPG
jgi:hypothetical protein